MVVGSVLPPSLFPKIQFQSLTFMILFLRIASLFVLRPLHPEGGFVGGWKTPLIGVTLTSGLLGGLSWLLLWDWGWFWEEDIAGEDAGPPPGAARGLRVMRAHLFGSWSTQSPNFLLVTFHSSKSEFLSECLLRNESLSLRLLYLLVWRVGQLQLSMKPREMFLVI